MGLSWRGSLVAAKVISLTPKDVNSVQIQREIDILGYLRCLRHIMYNTRACFVVN